VTDQTAPELLDALAGLVADRLSRRRSVDRKVYTRQEAADSLRMSLDHFERHIQPDLRVVRSGRLVLIPTTELDRWLDRNAARTLDGRTA
jgi:excisionase family DNA binding protein